MRACFPVAISVYGLVHLIELLVRLVKVSAQEQLHAVEQAHVQLGVQAAHHCFVVSAVLVEGCLYPVRGAVVTAARISAPAVVQTRQRVCIQTQRVSKQICVHVLQTPVCGARRPKILLFERGKEFAVCRTADAGLEKKHA